MNSRLTAAHEAHSMLWVITKGQPSWKDHMHMLISGKPAMSALQNIEAAKVAEPTVFCNASGFAAG